ncbi:hypothetical protein OEA41_003174 [Lepraria neglecta]|uniref:Essential protein Yae1 N-terminal domain-containing protein n=1 Tax=Lepraria neglecta TaxID=209136 RepID=A0AAD9Z481_9LECA|nr:hypothetical protein OEA41_003174 [Lepraria neglecta]
MAPEIDPDLFDDLLCLEDKFYKEGYDLGITDGDREGLIEGRLFGLKQGFEKYAAMGKLHGRAMIWAGRLPSSKAGTTVHSKEVEEENARKALKRLSLDEKKEGDTLGRKVPDLPKNARLENHVRTLYALTEPVSFSTENGEDAMQDFEERLHQAEAKVKIIERLTGEVSPDEAVGNPLAKGHRSLPKGAANKKGDGDIEDVNVLQVRH